MTTKRAHTTVFALLAFSMALLMSVPTFGHDPLQDSHAQRSQQHALVLNRLNLADVRAKLVTFRETGDDRYLDDAWQMLAPMMESGRASAETLIVASFVAQSRHEFSSAIRLIRKSLAINGNNDEAWLLLASIHLVRGDASSAGKACSRLRATSPVVLVTCKARVALATGDHEIALDRLQKILAVIGDSELAADTLAWSYSVAGDLAVAASASEAAISWYRKSLLLAERTQVRSALVDVFLSRADYGAATRTLDQGSLALPLLVRRLIVAKHLGQLQQLQPTLARVQRQFEVWIANDDRLHAREMARFYIDVVDKPARARRLALINLSLQQEPEDRRLEQRTRLDALAPTQTLVDYVLIDRNEETSSAQASRILSQ